jgi:hypothetical protein
MPGKFFRSLQPLARFSSLAVTVSALNIVGCAAPAASSGASTATSIATSTATAHATSTRLAAASATTPAATQTTKPSNPAPKTLRAFFIGNSVTDTIRYDQLGELVASRGHKYEHGRHMIPGSPLFLLWDASEKNNGFKVDKFGYSQQALTSFAWDAVSFQPFDRGIFDAKEGDLTIINRYIKLAQAKNPDTQFYIYARWPRMYEGGKGASFDKNDYDPTKPGSGADVSKIDDYAKQWTRTFNEGGWWDGSNETRNFFETLLIEVRKSNPTLKKKPLIIPVGEAMNDINVLMKEGKIPGYTTIYNFYRDGIHLNEPGSYLVACTFYATMLRESPVGLPSEPYGVTDKKLAEAIQRSVWKTVTTYPYSGVKLKKKTS